MLTNTMVRQIGEMQKENRRLKSKQTILGSTVATGSSATKVMAINITGGIPQSAVIVGSMTVTLAGIDGADINSAPMMSFNVIASASANIVLGDNDLPQYPTQGGLSFNWAPTSISDSGVAVINFILTLNYQLATQGGSVYFQLFASGPAIISSVTEQHHAIIN